ncbi:hypothetical protein [Methyloversatilis sp. XJ19-49]|uniref:hypothetical protein n=1 Tax=Methyloversatilis sp. XJ19-49 TaxID=2963429 RepID=UPI00211BF30F|nr:hypothetical protein [Methyloversatilis sp. XJ19-49]MCQ9379885.1 hypothetical protein [Methyloversatilis sp. XJ19-49]
MTADNTKNANLRQLPREARRSSVDMLNSACFCLSLDGKALAHALDLELGQPGLAEMVRQRSPFLFAALPVFVATPQLHRMAQVMEAVESVVALPAYREQVLGAAPAIARLGARGPLGAFFGYDFHLSQGHLGLIEINTNAGGAMLNAVLARAQRACCAAVDSMVPTLASVIFFEQQIVAMFRHEWALAHETSCLSASTQALASIAIVDVAPQDQYLYPEFLLFQQLFERHGLRTVIADPAALEWRDGMLWHGDLAIDLVYNRLTDFYLEQPGSAALREAYLQHAVVLTPHPQAHALYADKRLLALFSDAARLQALGVPHATQQILLEHVPHTEVVDAGDAQRLWDARRSLFFKPVAGFGGRAAYRGDKLTKRVWHDILAGEYVAQAIVAPGERVIDDPRAAEAQRAPKAMKYDLRAYAYNGAVQWVAARMYQGQTTNFRTPGGGFAPVYSSPDASGRSVQACTGTAGADEAAHASYVFLLDESRGVHAVPHALYVALVRGEAKLDAMAGQTLRLAIWYVNLKDDAPDSVVNETYSLVGFDAQGRIDPAHAAIAAQKHATTLENAVWPTAAERGQIRELLFADAGTSDASPTAAKTGITESDCLHRSADSTG